MSTLTINAANKYFDGVSINVTYTANIPIEVPHTFTTSGPAFNNSGTTSISSGTNVPLVLTRLDTSTVIFPSDVGTYTINIFEVPEIILATVTFTIIFELIESIGGPVLLLGPPVFGGTILAVLIPVQRSRPRPDPLLLPNPY